MLAKDTAPFEAALERLKKADSDLRLLVQRLDQAGERLLAAKLETSAVDKRIAEFARDGSSDVAQASGLVEQQTRARAVESLLEQSIESLTAALAGAKADVLLAERECAAAQLAYHQKIQGDMVAEFLASQKAELANLTAQMCLVERFRGDPIPSTPNVLNVIHLLTDGARQSLGEGLHASVKVKETPITTLQRSEAIDAQTRARVGIGAHNGRDYLVSLLTQAPPAKPEPFDMGFALQSARNAARAAEDNRSQLELAQQQLRIHPGDPNIQKRIADLKAEVDRCDQIVENWDARITEYRASQES